MATSEQNEAIGQFKLLRLEKKMKLLKATHGPRHSSTITNIITGLLAPIVVILSDKFFPHNYALMLLLLLLPTIWSVGYEARRANSRLDALLQLIGDENLVNEKN